MADLPRLNRVILILLTALALGGCKEWIESLNGPEGTRFEGPGCPWLQEVADSVDLAHQGYADFKDKRCEGIDWNEEE